MKQKWISILGKETFMKEHIKLWTFFDTVYGKILQDQKIDEQEEESPCNVSPNYVSQNKMIRFWKWNYEQKFFQ